MKRTKEARMDLDRERPVQGADESRIFYDKYKRETINISGSFTSNQDLVLLSPTPTTAIHNPLQRDHKGIRKFIL